MDKALERVLRGWAKAYNHPDFIENDPISFPHRFTGKRDIEISAFLMTWIAYGNRKVILRKGEELHRYMEHHPSRFILERRFGSFANRYECFYRFYKFTDLYAVCDRLHAVYTRFESLEEAVISVNAADPIQALQQLFRGVKGIPHTPGSACKRLAMFLRWVVRRDGIVDLGIWQRIDPARLLIPLDTHVYTVAHEIGITTRKAADMKTAVEITDYLKRLWPDDPCLGDFALFGYGVNRKKEATGSGWGAL